MITCVLSAHDNERREPGCYRCFTHQTTTYLVQHDCADLTALRERTVFKGQEGTVCLVGIYCLLDGRCVLKNRNEEWNEHNCPLRSPEHVSLLTESL